MPSAYHCRSCGCGDSWPVIDLGLQPLANNLLSPGDLEKPEPRFPLAVRVCTGCWLMQITETVPPVTLFSDYLYFSSFSDQMLRHAREASLHYIAEKKLSSESFVVEIASNDGYLLKTFVESGIPCLGIEPAANIAEVARREGIETSCEFFGAMTASAVRDVRGAADLIIGNNVFAHVPEINDFVAGLFKLLKSDGWAVLEFPYAVDMIDNVEFDTIYHEHAFYFTLTPLIPLFARHGLEIFHQERLSIHGGSLRIYASHHGSEAVRDSVRVLLADEAARGVPGADFYQSFAKRAALVRVELIDFLNAQKAAGRRVAAYGASAKGSTLLNYVGEAAQAIEFIADRSTFKQGRLSPGLHIPIVGPQELAVKGADYALLLVWNFNEEVMAQQKNYRDSGGKFVIPLPKLRIA